MGTGVTGGGVSATGREVEVGDGIPGGAVGIGTSVGVAARDAGAGVGTEVGVFGMGVGTGVAGGVVGTGTAVAGALVGWPASEQATSAIATAMSIVVYMMRGVIFSGSTSCFACT